jgi:hypothetical protein
MQMPRRSPATKRAAVGLHAATVQPRAALRLGALAAPLRLALGIGQMMGALTALALLVTEGATARTVVATIATSLLTITSIALFGRPPRVRDARP